MVLWQRASFKAKNAVTQLVRRTDCTAIIDVFKGSRRKLSEKYGLKVWLRADVHRLMHDHNPPYETLENDLKAIAQQAFEDNGGTREEFRAIFGASYL